MIIIKFDQNGILATKFVTPQVRHPERREGSPID
jgi:hypothetical protein